MNSASAVQESSSNARQQQDVTPSNDQPPTEFTSIECAAASSENQPAERPNPDASFAAHFESLKQLMKAHYPNGGYVLQSECSCDNILWNWVVNIRCRRRQQEQGRPCERISEEQIAQLDAIGFLWERTTNLLEKPTFLLEKEPTDVPHFESLKKIMNSCYPKGGYVTKKDCGGHNTLWKWIQNIRYWRLIGAAHGSNDGRLTDQQIAELDFMGFLWEEPTANSRHFESLKLIMKSHYPNGGYVIPKDCSGCVTRTLASWIRNIRSTRCQEKAGKPRGSYGSLTDEQIAQLDAMGFLWEDPSISSQPRESSFAKHFKSLKQLMRAHYPNGGYVLQSHCACDKTLWKWIVNIRCRRRQQEQGKPCARITDEEIAQLDAIGFLWEDPDVIFARHLESLKELMKSHYPNGGYVIPKDCSNCDKTLAAWIKKIRKFRQQKERQGKPDSGDHGSLTDEQIAQLDAMGFLWEDPSKYRDRDAAFARHFESLKTLMKVHYPNGGFVHPCDCHCDKPLRNWIHRIRRYRNCKKNGIPHHGITNHQIAQLHAIGFLWEDPSISSLCSEFSFAKHFKSLKSLMKSHYPNGGFVLQSECKCDDALWRWINTIRGRGRAIRAYRRHKAPVKMNKEIAQLDAIGFLWENPSKSQDTSKQEAQYPTSSQSLMPNLQDTMVGSEDSFKSKDPDATFAKYFESSIPNLSRTMATSSVETTTAALQSLPSSTVPQTPIMVEAPSELHPAFVPTVPWNPLGGYQQHLSVVPFPPPVFYPPSSILNPYRPLMVNPWFSINYSNQNNMAQQQLQVAETTGFRWEDPSKSGGTSRLSTRAHNPDATFAAHFESLKELMKTHYPNGGYVLQSECKCDNTLWNWIMQIRCRRRQQEQGRPCERISDEQIAQLDAIGFLWENTTSLLEKPT